MLNFSVKLKGQTESDDIILNKNSGLLNAESLTQSTGNAREISYGAVANRGSLEVFDINGDIEKKLQDGTLQVNNLPVEIIVNGNTIQKHIANDGDYADKVFSLTLSNEIENLDNKIYTGYINTNGANLYTIVENAFSQVGYDIKTAVDETIKARLESIYYSPAFIPSMSFKDFIDKLCEITFLAFIVDQDGTPKFIDMLEINLERGIIRVPNKNIYPTPSKDVIIKNQLGKIEWQEYGISITDDNVLLTNNIVENQISQPNENNQQYIYNPSQDYLKSYISTIPNDWEKASQPQIFIGRFEGYNKKYNFTIQNKADIISVNPEIENLIIKRADYSFKPSSYTDTNFVYNGKDFAPQTFSTKSDLNATINTIINIFDKDKRTDTVLNIGKGTWRNYGIYVGARSQNYGQIDELTISNLYYNGNFRDISQEYENNTKVIYDKNTNTYNVEFDLCIFAARYKYTFSVTYDTKGTLWTLSKTDEDNYITVVTAISFTINGTQYVLDLYNTINHAGDLTSSKTYILPQNKFIQQNTRVSSNSVKTVGSYVAENLLNHYANGLATAKVRVAYTDFYDTYGNLTISKDKGEMFKLGDIIVVDKDNEKNARWKYADGSPMYWRITGIDVVKEGNMQIDLELQEV